MRCHADILREEIDGRAGARVDDPNVPRQSADQWATYGAPLERAAEQAPAGRVSQDS